MATSSLVFPIITLTLGLLGMIPLVLILCPLDFYSIVLNKNEKKTVESSIIPALIYF